MGFTPALYSNPIDSDPLTQALTDFEQLVIKDSSNTRMVEYLALTERLIAYLLLGESTEQARTISSRAHNRMLELTELATVRPRTALNAAIVAETHGRILSASGDTASAQDIWRHALELLELSNDSDLVKLGVQRQLICHLQGDKATLQLDARLVNAGFQDPRFL